MIAALLCLSVLGCDSLKDCSERPGCPPKAECGCDAQGRLVRELRDINKDGKTDRTVFRHNANGQLLSQDVDYANDSIIERHVSYTYDANGQRLTRAGWQLRCDGSKFRWNCRFAKPCAAPFEQCAPCRSTHTLEKDGKIEPCGASAAKPKR